MKKAFAIILITACLGLTACSDLSWIFDDVVWDESSDPGAQPSEPTILSESWSDYDVTWKLSADNKQSSANMYQSFFSQTFAHSNFVVSLESAKLTFYEIVDGTKDYVEYANGQKRWLFIENNKYYEATDAGDYHILDEVNENTYQEYCSFYKDYISFIDGDETTSTYKCELKGKSSSSTNKSLELLELNIETQQEKMSLKALSSNDLVQYIETTLIDEDNNKMTFRLSFEYDNAKVTFLDMSDWLSIYEPNDGSLDPSPDITDDTKGNEQSKHNFDKDYLVVSQWNVGQFGYGNAKSSVGPYNYDTMKWHWKKEIDKQNADVCGLIEYNPIFGTNIYGQKVSPDNAIWKEYPYKTCFRQAFASQWYGGNAVNSFFTLKNAKKKKYACFKGFIGPNEATHKLLKEAFYTVADMEYNGVTVKVVECSVPYNSASILDNTYQRLAYNELVKTFKRDPYVIIMGDFELVNNNDYKLFTNKGFALCNGGDFGWFASCPKNHTLVPGVSALDNIIVKGFTIKDVKMNISDLSDHYPLIASLQLKPQSN